MEVNWVLIPLWVLARVSEGRFSSIGGGEPVLLRWSRDFPTSAGSAEEVSGDFGLARFAGGSLRGVPGF